MVELVVSRYGGVPRGFADLVERILRSFYESVRAEGPLFVEVLIYGRGVEPLELLQAEAAELGVRVLGGYPVSHEAWMGWPRIHVDYGRCSGLDPGLLEALLVHEAAHSVLHGSRSYYALRVGGELLDLLGPRYALAALYLASTAVKDLEVHGYLVGAGFREHVERYAEYAVSEAGDLECSDLLEVLALAKLASPCLYVACPGLPGSLGRGCARILEPLLRTLADLGSSGKDWSERSVALVRAAAELLRPL